VQPGGGAEQREGGRPDDLGDGLGRDALLLVGFEAPVPIERALAPRRSGAGVEVPQLGRDRRAHGRSTDA
jgi:hypothetical protein